MTNGYIRRQDAVDDLHTQLMYRMGSDDMKRRLDDWVKTLPSADVAPVAHAHWIDGYRWQTCSKCRNKGKKSWKFCPNCGALMDAKGEE